MKTRTICSAALIAIALGMVPVASEAREPPKQKLPTNEVEEKARQFYDAGVALFNVQDWRGALRNFEQAYAMGAESNRFSNLLWNMGVCQEKLNEWKKAAMAYQEFSNSLSAEQRAKDPRLKDAIERMERMGRIQEQPSIPTPPPPTAVAPPPKPKPDDEAVKKAAEEEKRRRMELEQTIQGNPPALMEEPSWPKRHTKSLAIGGGAVVLGIVSAGLLGSAVANHEDYGNGSRNETMAISGIVFGGVALAAAVAAAVIGLKYEPGTKTPMDTKLEFVPKVVDGKVVDKTPATAKK